MKKTTFRVPIRVPIILLIIAGLFIGFCLYQSEPDFLLDRYYERAYPDRLAAVPAVMLGETPVTFDMTEETWSFRKKNGQWYTPPKESDKIDVSEYEPKPASNITAVGGKLAVIVDKAPSLAELKIIDTESGQVVQEGRVLTDAQASEDDPAILNDQALLSSLPLPARNGRFTYELSIEWTEETSPYRGRYMIEIPVMVDLPPQFIFSAEKLSQGQLLEITVNYAENPADIVFSQSIYSKFQWYQEDGFLRGYLPTNYLVNPGKYVIKYGSKSDGIELAKEITVAKHEYDVQYLTVDPQTQEDTQSDAAYAEYHKYYTPVRDKSEPERYYAEDFLIPVTGRLSTEFGQIRYVNDATSSTRHLGMDIATPEGTEIKAVNRGKVVLARFLTLTGNTVIIDHGEGLFSCYHHMLNLSVKTGDIAERGQKIGEVGTTGFSTGPHLHFMMSYYQMNLEPGYFLAGRPVTYENYKEILH